MLRCVGLLQYIQFKVFVPNFSASHTVITRWALCREDYSNHQINLCLVLQQCENYICASISITWVVTTVFMQSLTASWHCEMIVTVSSVPHSGIFENTSLIKQFKKKSTCCTVSVILLNVILYYLGFLLRLMQSSPLCTTKGSATGLMKI